MRRGMLIALLLATACKKEPPAGDLPPAGAAAKPQGDSTGNATAAVPSPVVEPPNPHAAPPNPHAAAPDGPPTAAKTAPTSLEKLADGRLALGPFSVVPPPKWTTKPITSSMRAANFLLPKGDGELIVYYFGEGGAGSVEDNLDRWLNQFQQPDGKKSRDVAKIDKMKAAGQDAIYVSVTGRFVAGAMPGATEAVDKPDQRMLAAIVDSPTGPYYFKLVGAKAAVDAESDAFLAMLNSLKLR